MKRTISLILALIMIMAVAPLNAFAIEPDKAVENIEITIDTRIAGKTPSECADFLTVRGEGIEFDYSTFKATYIDGHFNSGVKEAEVFEEGISYSSILYIYPADGYILPYYTENSNIKYTVIREAGTFDGSYTITSEEHYGDELAGYYKILIHYSAEPQVPTGAAKIPYLIGKFFESIANFFTKTLIQPIVDLIMKLS
ncbi:MAG: hypothetical protein IKK63_06730 [Clostridia bacterium]|nr:hypothetical protein [Clostridia bacterium]